MFVYADHASTTPLDPKVENAMREYFSEKFANPSSLFYNRGYEVREAIEKSREKVLEFLNAPEGSLVFTSGGTEANNLAILGYARRNKGKSKRIITTGIEHGSVLKPLEQLEREGFEVVKVPVDNTGRVVLEELEKELKKGALMVSIGHANVEIGTVQDIKEIGRLCQEHDTVFHLNACYSFGKIELDLKKVPADLVSVTCHKTYGPKGAGGLYIRRGVSVDPIIFGSGQENGLRSGMPDVPAIIGLGKIAEIRAKEMEKEAERLRELEKPLLELLDVPHSWLNGHEVHRIPGHLNVSFRYVEGEAMVALLDAKGVIVSTGSACSSPNLRASHVLLGIGLKPEDVNGSLRISLGKSNNEEHVDYMLREIPEVVERLRKISAWRPEE